MVLLVGLPFCPSGVSGGPAALLAEGCWVLVLWFFLCCVRLWCGRCSRFGVLCLFVGLLLVAAVVVCVVCARVCLVCWWCVWVPVLASLGLGWRLCVGGGAVCRGPSPALAVGLGGGSLPILAGVCWWWWVPPPPPLRALSSPLFLFAASPGALFPWCLVRVYQGCGGCAPGLGEGGERSLTLARVPSPGVSPWGGRCLHSPSGCNSVVRAVHLYPLGKIGPAP